MDRPEARELLMATHEFPGTYLFKVIGYQRNDFVGRTMDAVRDVIGRALPLTPQTRQTESGKHIAVTLEPFVDDCDQVLDIYSNFREVDDVIMYW
jgi:uncharacterized protein